MTLQVFRKIGSQIVLNCGVVVFTGIFSYGQILHAAGEGSLREIGQLEGTEVIDKLGNKIPDSLTFTNEKGELIKFSEILQRNGGGKPTILTLGYYQCPMLCSLVQNGLVNGLNKIPFRAGKDFNLVSISIDPKEGPSLAQAKKNNYTKAVGLPAEGDEWSFLVGTESEIKKIAGAVGFGYKWDEKSKQYIHSAAIFILSPEGVLSRTLWGINYKPSDLRLAIVEAGEGKVGTVIDRILLSCFHYDPDSHRYGFYILGIMKIGGILTIILLGGFLLILWRRDKRNLAV